VLAVVLACPKTSIVWVKQVKMSPNAMSAIRINISFSFSFSSICSIGTSSRDITHQRAAVAKGPDGLNSRTLYRHNSGTRSCP
jgi:hypothetical protein